MNWIFLNAIKGNDWGGMENWMVKLCRGLPRHGDRCLIAARPLSRWPERCAQEGIPFTPFSYGFDLAPWAIARLRRIGRDFKPDVVMVKGFRAARFARLAWPDAAIGVKLPLAQDLKDGFIDRWTYSTCIDRVLTDNHAARAGFLEYPWVLPGKIVIAHNGVALPSPEPGPESRASLRRSFNLADDALLIGSAGRLESDKNFAHAIEALARLPRDLPVTLLLLGEGPEKQTLMALAERLRVSDRVLFAGWRENARELLWGCDAVLHPSGNEGLPNVVLEAMAGGIPVVATDAGGTREIITNHHVGRLVPIGDVAAMSAALLELLRAGSLRSEMGSAATLHVRTHFSLERMVETVRSAMEQAWNARRDKCSQATVTPSGAAWLQASSRALGPEALTWDQCTGAALVSRSSHADVHRLHTGDSTLYLKRFLGRRLTLRRLGLRPPIALDNFRTAACLTLRGAAVVPHLAAGWNFGSPSGDESLLVTGTIPNAITLDGWSRSQLPHPGSRRELACELAVWLAYLHGAGVACHDLKASNVLVHRQENGTLEFTLLDLDNCRLRWIHATDHDVQRNFHQLFRSFQPLAAPFAILRFLAVYRQARRLDRQQFRRLTARVEQRLHRRGTGYAELLAAHRAGAAQ